MNHLRGVLFLAFALLIVQVLAEEGRERQEFGNFGSLSTDANVASDVRAVPLRTSNVESLAAGNSRNAEYTVSSTDEASTRNYFAQDSVFQSEDGVFKGFDESQVAGASQSDFDYQEARRQVEKRQKRASYALEVDFTFTSSDTNATVSTAICGALNSSVTRLSVTNNAGIAKLFQIPACLATSSLTVVDLNYMTTSSFNVLPTAMRIFYCTYCRIRQDFTGASTPVANTPAAQTTDGFNSDGSISWTELFTTFPNLANIDFFFNSLKAVMPTAPPARLQFLRLRGIQYNFNDPMDGLTGELPSTFFSNIGPASNSTYGMFLDISYNRLNGTISAGYFSGFTGRQWNAFTFIGYGCKFSGTIPAALFTPLQFANLANFDFSVATTNTLYGSLPAIPAGMMAAGSTLNLGFGACAFNGSFPDAYLAGLPDGVVLGLDVANNFFTGSLPSTLFSATHYPASFSLSMQGNLFSGSLTNFMSSTLTANRTVSYYSVNLSGNKLTGTIPDNFVCNDVSSKRDSYAAIEGGNGVSKDSEQIALSRSSSATSRVGLQATYSFLLSLSNNGLTGEIPSNLLAASFDPAGALNLGGVTVDFSNNLLSGTLPSDFLVGLPSTLTGSIVTAFKNNSFTGPVPGFCSPTGPLTIDMSQNNLTGPIPTSWESCMLRQVTLNDNPYLSGSIPTDLFTATGISGFAAKNSSLTGYLPPLGATLSSIDLSYSKFNFCDSYSVASFGSYDATCTLESSDACNCASEYTQCGSTITCPPPGFLPPYMAPSVPIEPVAQPTATPVPVTANPPPSNCPPESTRPGPEFTCVSGFWTAPAVTNAALVVPAGAGKVVVTGNIDSDEVVLRDLSSSVEVNGCANNLNSINVELTKEDAEQIGSGTTTKTLITTSPSGCNTLNTVNLNTQVSNEGCKKLKTTKQVSPNGSTLNALFSLQTSSCNTWWIILVSVVCGVILLAIILIVILVTCCDCCKKKARPFAGSDGRYSV